MNKPIKNLTKLDKQLIALDGCEGARTWAEDFPDIQAAWAACDRGDWMMWLLAKSEVDIKLIALAACQCVRMPRECIPDWEHRPLAAVSAVEAWAAGTGPAEVATAACAAVSDVPDPVLPSQRVALRGVVRLVRFMSRMTVYWVDATHYVDDVAAAKAYADAYGAAWNELEAIARRDCAAAIRKVVSGDVVAAALVRCFSKLQVSMWTRRRKGYRLGSDVPRGCGTPINL